MIRRDERDDQDGDGHDGNGVARDDQDHDGDERDGTDGGRDDLDAGPRGGRGAMTRARIGHTGFVGGNLKAQSVFDDLYNSTNIESIAGRRYDLVVSAGAPAAKWIANKEPAADLATIERLISALSQVEAERFVLISSVDVDPRPVDVDETTPIDFAALHPYGRHRLMLEQFVSQRFRGASILRLPGLFGPGLKKNVVYDFLNDNRLDLVHQDGVFQFYDLAHVWRDVQRCLDARLDVVNIATQPVSVRDVAEHAFGRAFTNTLPPPAPRYDFRTVHAASFGRKGPYLASSDEVLADMKRFVQSQRGARA
jgi:nucleoside-diphosphate-sugar epimerase